MLEPSRQDFATLLRSGARASDAAFWQAFVDDANRWRPDGYDAAITELRRQYDSHMSEHLKDAARQRYPFTGARMPPLPYSWAELFAVNGASVYDLPAQRSLSVAGKAVEPGDDERAKAFADMLTEAQIDTVMAEVERITVLAKTCFVRVRSDSLEALALGTEPRTVLDTFWPTDVLVVPHPRAPASLATAFGVALRVSGDHGVTGSGSAWELWSRTYEDDEQGMPSSYGPWTVDRVTERHAKNTATGKMEREVTVERVLWATPGGGSTDNYPLPTLPILALHARHLTGAPIVDASRNLVPIFDAINVALMNEQFTNDMNAAASLIRKTDSPSPERVVLGPGTLANIRTDEDVIAIQTGADFTGIRQAIRGMQGNLALTSRQRADGLDVEAASVPQSGVALEIKNEPQRKARVEAVQRAVAFETRPRVGLLPVMAEVNDHWRATSIGGDDVTFVMRPQDPPVYEEPEARQRRALDAESAGLISKAKAAVLSGYYRTEKEAQESIDAIRKERESRPSSMQVALARAAFRQPPAVADDMPDGEDPTDPDGQPVTK